MCSSASTENDHLLQIENMNSLIPSVHSILMFFFFFIKFDISAYRNLPNVWIIQLWYWNHSQRKCIPCSNHQDFFCLFWYVSINYALKHPWCPIPSFLPLHASCGVIFYRLLVGLRFRIQMHILQLQPRKLWASTSASACFSPCSELFDSFSQSPAFCWGKYDVVRVYRSPLLRRKFQISLVNSPPLSDLMDFRKYPLFLQRS